MGIQVKENHVHWNYFIALEQDLAKVSRFIEFSELNFETYSIELAHLLLAASSEVDVVLKALCNLKNPNKNHGNIDQYQETIKAVLPGLINEKSFIPRYGLELKPWDNWNGDDNPLWWRSYNNVKHERNKYFHEANLKNTINSVAALGLVVLYYYLEVFSREDLEPNMDIIDIQKRKNYAFREVTSRLQPYSSLVKFDDSYENHNLMV